MTATAAVDELAARIDQAGTPACVGLDPVLDRLPPDLLTDGANADDPPRAIECFCNGVIEAIAGVVPVVKVQAACFERYGSAGWAVMERVIPHARRSGLFVLLDAKRGDIGTSAAHYAASAAAIGAQAITVNPYLGRSGVEPFLDAGLMVFALCRTSNPDSGEVQTAELARGGSVAVHMARFIDSIGREQMGDCGLSAVGAVVGATHAGECQALREAMPHSVLLTPGIGAQGASASDIAPLRRRGASIPAQAGLLPTASRSVLYPDTSAESVPAIGWADAVSKAARAFAAEATHAAIGR